MVTIARERVVAGGDAPETREPGERPFDDRLLRRSP